MNKFFQGLVFSLSLSTESLKEKNEISKFIKEFGGTISFSVSKQTTHLIASEKEITSLSLKVRSAIHQDCWIVLPSFIYQSVALNKKDDEWNHLIINKIRKKEATSESFYDQEETMSVNSSDSTTYDQFSNVDEFLHFHFSQAIQNVSQAFEDKFIENLFKQAIYNITGVCAYVIGQYETHIIYKGDTQGLIDEMYFNMEYEKIQNKSSETTQPASIQKPFSSKFQYTPSSLSRTKKKEPQSQPSLSISSELRVPSFNIAPSGNDFLDGFFQIGPSAPTLSFKERAALRQKEWEAKKKEREQQALKRQKELKMKEAEKKRALERKKKQVEEKKRKEEKLKLQAQRKKVLLQNEEQLNKKGTIFSSTQLPTKERQLDISSYTTLLQQAEQEKQELELKYERERLKQKIKQKNERKRKHIENKKERHQEWLKEKEATINLRRQMKQEAEKKRLEEEKRIEALKEYRRQAYAARMERKKQRILSGEVIEEKKPPEDPRKVFIGGISFRDFEKLKVKLTPEKEQDVKQKRIELYYQLFQTFGKIEIFKDNIVEKKHCFIVFQEEASVENLLQGLGTWEKRLEATKKIKDELKSKVGLEQASLLAPSPHFYVRKVYAITNPKKNKKKKKKKLKEKNQEKEKSVIPQVN